MGRLHRYIVVGLVAALLLVAADRVESPADQRTARLVISAIRVYQNTIGPHLGATCRFTPTCSHYAAAAIEARGLPAGSWLAVRRIVRCGPWTPLGTSDPPPE